MKQIVKNQKEAEILCTVAEGQWGTIGPCFLKADEVIARHCGADYALVVFSASAALETILRANNIGYTDEVIVGAWSDPVDAMTVAAVGATPVFSDVSREHHTLSPAEIASCVNRHTRAVIADLPPCEPFDVASLSEFCREHNLYLILNLNDTWGAEQNGLPLHKYADASFLNMSEGCVLDLGLAGAVLTDHEQDFNLFYAYHNCGRPMGDGATLSFDEIIGGDLRIAEWQASLIPGRLEQIEALLAKDEGRLGISKQVTRDLIAAAPVWQDPYITKLTGRQLPAFTQSRYPNSIEAAKIKALCGKE